MACGLDFTDTHCPLLLAGLSLPAAGEEAWLMAEVLPHNVLPDVLSFCGISDLGGGGGAAALVPACPSSASWVVICK